MPVMHKPSVASRRAAGPWRLLCTGFALLSTVPVLAQDHLYAGLFVPGTAGPAPHCGLTFAQLESVSGTNTGLRSRQITSVTTEGDRFCATLSEGRTRTAVFRDTNAAALQRRLDQPGNRFGIIDLEAIDARGRSEYVSVWQDQAPRGELAAELDARQFASRFKEMERNGMRVVAMAVSPRADTALFSAYFAPGPRVQVLASSARWSEFPALHERNRRNGMALVDLEVYDVRGERLVAALWQETRGEGRLIYDVDWPTFRTRFGAMGREPLRLIAVRAYPARRGTGSGTPTPDVQDGTDPSPEPETPDPAPEPTGDATPPGSEEPAPDSGSPGGGATGAPTGGSIGAFTTQFGGRCRIRAQSINTCGESMGQSPAHIAARIQALQTASGMSCCDAVDQAESEFGGRDCDVVLQPEKDRYGCEPSQ